MGRIKLATSPASRCFLVALFIFGFASSYVANLPSKDGQTVTLAQTPFISVADDQAEYRSPGILDCGRGTLVWRCSYQPCCY